jgi:hypothetical protein
MTRRAFLTAWSGNPQIVSVFFIFLSLWVQ